MANIKISFYIFISTKTWFFYTRRPHFAELSNFGKLKVVQNPLVIISSEFLTNALKALFFYFKYSFGIRQDTRSKADLIRPVLLFPVALKNRYSILNKIDYFLLQLQMKKISSNDEDEYKVYILTHKTQNWLVRKTNILYVLDINDEWSMINYNVSTQYTIEKAVRILLSKVDLATTVTNRLRDKYQTDGKVYFLPNAVDIHHYVPSFDTATVKKNETAFEFDLEFIRNGKTGPQKFIKSLDKIKAIKRPAVGSISGLSGNWSDFEFMNKVEELLPKKYSMISTGNIFPPTKEEFIPGYRKYIANPRMIYLEHLDYSILPGFLENIDVGIVMHRMDEFNKHSAPNKIWAYLAMGIPVVSTDFLDEEDKEIFEGLVYFAGTPEKYVSYIIKAFEENSKYLQYRRRDLAIKNSTYKRAQKLYNIINNKLTENICAE